MRRVIYNPEWASIVSILVMDAQIVYYGGLSSKHVVPTWVKLVSVYVVPLLLMAWISYAASRDRATITITSHRTDTERRWLMLHANYEPQPWTLDKRDRRVFRHLGGLTFAPAFGWRVNDAVHEMMLVAGRRFEYEVVNR
jgi:hypothetical protein